MSPESSKTLVELLRDNDFGWLIDLYDSPDEAAEPILKYLEKANTEYRRRFEEPSPVFTPERLSEESKRNPARIQAFLQAWEAALSPQMLVLAWRILQGMRIQEVTLEYRECERFNLRIVLNSPYEDKAEVYESGEISDAAVLRHFGQFLHNRQPVFDGFYPLQLDPLEKRG